MSRNWLVHLPKIRVKEVRDVSLNSWDMELMLNLEGVQSMLKPEKRPGANIGTAGG